MTALQKSFSDHADKIEKSQSVWIQTSRGWAHSYKKSLVKSTIIRLRRLANS